MDTPFLNQVKDWEQGKLKVPTVSTGAGTINFFLYQIAVNTQQLRLLSEGINTGRYDLGKIKSHYGLQGKTAKDWYREFKDKKQGLIETVTKAIKNKSLLQT